MRVVGWRAPLRFVGGGALSGWNDVPCFFVDYLNDTIYDSAFTGLLGLPVAPDVIYLFDRCVQFPVVIL